MAESRFVASMTGFARQDGGNDAMSWAWEIKSVNGKGLDVRCRLPNGYESLDQMVRTEVGKHCARGNLQVGLTVKRSAQAAKLRINQSVFQQIVEISRDLGDSLEAAAPRLDGLLSLPGVIEVDVDEESEQARGERDSAVLGDLHAALQDLVKARCSEGEKLSSLAAGHLESIADLASRAAGLAAVQPSALKERLLRQLSELLDGSQGLPEERIAQEVALLASKADVREELDRLSAHLEAARDLLATGGPVGRRLDFLCQELNREANTLCSKSVDLELTQVGLLLKSTIEQLREQIQNIE